MNSMCLQERVEQHNYLFRFHTLWGRELDGEWIKCTKVNGNEESKHLFGEGISFI